MINPIHECLDWVRLSVPKSQQTRRFSRPQRTASCRDAYAWTHVLHAQDVFSALLETFVAGRHGLFARQDSPRPAWECPEGCHTAVQK